VLWSTNGTGRFENPASLNPVYIPGASDILNKTVFLTMRALSSSPCGDSFDEMVLTISGYPAVNAGPDFTVCNASQFAISQATRSNVTNVRWITNGKGVLTQNGNAPPVYQPAPLEYGDIRFVMQADGTGGCSQLVVSDTMYVTVYEPLIIKASNDVNILKDMTTTLSVDIIKGSGNYSFRWDPLASVYNYNSNRTETLPVRSDTKFTILVTDLVTGCQASDTVFVGVEESIDDLLVIYNAISPNGDGNNDTWYIEGIELFPDNEVMIFNRWGDKIRDLRGYDNVNVFWDGTNNRGNLVPDGTYYYVLEIKGRKAFTGWIQVKSGY
jgi:gliding motility-associated-like protein